MNLAQIKTSTTANHVHQADSFIRFCDNYKVDFSYKVDFINPAPSTPWYDITRLTSIFTPSKCVRNYVSGVQFLHKQLGLARHYWTVFQCPAYLELQM